ncbi:MULTISPECIES: FecR domain-containing protein [unclassified Sinorhizobium]|uniref:FecR family protein n=1 Tax=unclassified Sinorhizobium TaxID=2613772 RepID=UPI003523D9A5
MLQLRRAAIVALCLTLCGPIPAMAAEQVGQAVLIKTEVTGASGPIVVKGPVHRDERIKTSQSGLGQFLFRDGTKLAVGWGSSVVIDKFVFDDSNSLQKLSIKAAKGTFRWVSGNSRSSAYEILTPAGTIGVRGTAFDFYVGPDGTTAIVLLGGAAQFCGPGGCRQLTRRCDCVVARPNGAMTNTRRVDRTVLSTIGGPRTLPFLAGGQRLGGGLGLLGSGCSLAALQDRPDRFLRQRTLQTEPDPTRPETPAPPSRPETPNNPDRPGNPGKPDKPGHDHGHGMPDRPDKPGHDHGNGKPDRPDKSGHDHGHGNPDRPDKSGHDHGYGKPDRSNNPGGHYGRHDRDDHDRGHRDRDQRDRDRDDGDRHDRGFNSKGPHDRDRS